MKKQIDITNKKEAHEMFLANKDSLYRFVLVKTKDPHLSQDLVSETFVKFFKYALKNKIDNKRVKNLLFTIASNTTADYYRKKKKITFVSFDNENNKRSHFLQDAITDKNNISAPAKSEINEKIETITDIAKNLPKKQQEAFYLRFTQNLNFAQIAEIQNTSVSTVLSRVRYSINKIKKSLNIRGVNDEV